MVIPESPYDWFTMSILKTWYLILLLPSPLALWYKTSISMFFSPFWLLMSIELTAWKESYCTLCQNFNTDSNGFHSNKFHLWSQRCWPLSPPISFHVMSLSPPVGPSHTSLHLSQARNLWPHLSFIESSIYFWEDKNLKLACNSGSIHHMGSVSRVGITCHNRQRRKHMKV